MANIKSAIKRIQITDRNTKRNRSARSEIKTYTKKFDEAIEKGEADQAQEILKTLDKKLKRASLKSAVSENYANRHLSRLHKKLNAVR